MFVFSQVIARHIQSLLDCLNDSNFDSIFRELSEFVEYSIEGSTLILKNFLNQANLDDNDAQNWQLKREMASAFFRHLLDRPNFVSVCSEVLKFTETSNDSLEHLCDSLKLSIVERILVGLALTESGNPEFRMRGKNFCIAHIEELCANPNSVVSDNRIQEFVMSLYLSESLSKHVDTFTNMLSLVQLNESSRFILSPMLMDDSSMNHKLRKNLDVFFSYSESDFDSVLEEIEKEISMTDILKELGHGFTSSTSHCVEALSFFLPLDEIALAKLISTVIRTRIAQDDVQISYATICSALGINFAVDVGIHSWNIDVLVDSIKQIAPKTNWIHVMENLDHEGFLVPDETAFNLLMSVYNSACQEPFPLHAVCGSVWMNAEGQLSFLRYAVTASLDVFTFAHSSRKLAYMDSITGTGNQAWLSLDLLDVLCHLAERGHVSVIRSILKNPLSICPDILLIGISQINTAYNLLQYEVSSIVLPILLRDSSKVSAVCHLWQVNSRLVLREFLNMYASDTENIMTILSICKELKILPTVLDISPFPFSIRLAAVASHNDYLNLEKWLDENMASYKDSFFEECLNFLKYAVSDVSDNDVHISLRHLSSSLLNIFHGTCSIFFKVLQAHCVQNTPHQLIDELKRLHCLFKPIIPHTEPTDSASAEGNSDEIETVANAYFHQMFSGELTVDAMIQMLARFKESSVKREQSIFDCIVSNLFEEYKFFPKYPDKQLKLAAILFGSLIKHQLINSITLGVALRGVLDALRKSVDSKMFVFGIKALEQFMDRLAEWPLYCNHILQISQLRVSHPDLVLFTERALARTSSSQSDSSGIGALASEQQQILTPISVESMEVSDSSWQFMGSSATHTGQQLPTFQPRQRHLGFLEDRLKATGTLNLTKLSPSHASQSSLLSAPVDPVGGQLSSLQSLPTSNSQYSASLTAVSSSPGFTRPPRSITPAGIRQTSYSTGFGSALNIETLVAAAERREIQIEAPPQEVQDKIFFLINNISAANMESKAKEFTEVLNEQYFPWFAQYMVMKRASIEPNFHDLYLKFLDKVDSKSLNKEIVKATYENCKVLLRSDLIKSSSEERSLLKNLGSWLGKFTIGRNQVLRAKEIDPKILIMEAYEKGLMIAVVPFTSKILEPCQTSLAYQPPNPWTMGILGLLVEIYNLPNLKMNLKFDIEVLFKNLGVDIKDVKPSSLLKDRVREVEGNPDFSNKDNVTSQPSVTEISTGNISAVNQVEELKNTSYSTGPLNLPNQYASVLQHASSSVLVDDKIGVMVPDRVASGPGPSQVTSPPSPYSFSQLQPLINNYDAYINVNQNLTSMGLQFHGIIQLALDRAIREIVSPVIQRSVTIASLTTREIVLKDFAIEPDDSIISRAARMMVGTLAGKLAHVTCKEPLRVAFSNHLRNVLQAINVGSELDQIVQNIITDNLDLGCAVIENVASAKAFELIEGELAPAFASLRKHREAAGSSFYDVGGLGPFACVPEALRPKPGHLTAAQQQVYKDFVRNTGQNLSSQSSNSVRGGSVGSSLPRVFGSTSGQRRSSMYSTSQAAPGFNMVGQALDLLPEESDRSSVPLSTPSSQVGSGAIIIQPGGEVTSVASVPASIAPELQMLEASITVKDLGTSVPPSPTPTAAVDRLGTSLSESSSNTGEALEKYQLISQKLETLISKEGRDSEVQAVIAEVPDIILRCTNPDEAALALAQKVFKSLFEKACSNVHINAYIAILSAIRDVYKLVVKELTNWVIYSDEELKFNTEIAIELIRSDLLNLAEYNAHLSKLIEGGRNKAAVEFAVSLVEALVVQEPGFSMLELNSLVDALGKLATRQGDSETLQQLVELARNTSNNASSQLGFATSKEDRAKQSRDKKVLSGRSLGSKEDYNVSETIVADPAGLRDQVSLLLSEWCRICGLPTINEALHTHFILQLQQRGFLKGDDLTDRFFRILMELCVSHCLSTEHSMNTGSLSLQSVQPHNLTFTTIDACAKLIVTILKYGPTEQGSNKLVLLPKILSVALRVIQKDAEEKKFLFNPRPYFRLFINWLLDLTSPDPALDGMNYQVLTSFANVFHALQPLKVPGWSFAWLELISHRNFMPKLLTVNSPKGWPFFQRLLIDHFKFMEPYLRKAELGDSLQFLYKGTLRVLLVLLHDFPEFLCEYHFSFCDVIPPSCIQMRNVILSAFPRNMRLPDPSTPNLKIDLLAEISLSPRILSDVDGALKAKMMKADLDEYLKTRPEGSPFLAELKQRVLLSPNESNLAGTRYNVPLINSMVLYVGIQAIQQLQNKTTPQPVPHSPPMDIFLFGAAMDIFQYLITNLDAEGRYLFINAVTNQLRYPNNHTHFFSFVLLYLFNEASQEIIQEQITRVLVERLMGSRPYPWGLLITFIELIKNPRYNFWNCPFLHCTPEIEKLFETVPKTFGGQRLVDDGMIPGSLSDGTH